MLPHALRRLTPRIAVAAVVVALAALPVVILRSASSHEATVGVSVDLTPVPFATSGYTIHRVPAGQPCHRQPGHRGVAGHHPGTLPMLPFPPGHGRSRVFGPGE